MKWLKSLYVGEKIAQDKEAVMRLIRHPEWKSRFAFCCLISPAPQSGENLEVLPLFMLCQKHFNKQPAAQDDAGLSRCRRRRAGKGLFPESPG